MIRMVLLGPRQIALQEAEIPRPKGSQLLIRVCAASVCGADMALYEGLFDVNYPLVMGHDFSGTVEAVGAEVRTFKSGDRVAVDPQLSCGTCHFCRQGCSRFCADYSYMGKGISGAYQQYVLVEERCGHRLPDQVTFEHAAILEPFAVALHAFEFLRMLPGDTVVISGCGPIGLAHIRLAKAMGFRVLALEIMEERRMQAERFGADSAFDPFETDLGRRLQEKIHGRHFFVECAGASESLCACLSLIGRGGVMAMVGSSNTEVNLRSFLLKGLTFYGVRGGGGMYPRAIQLIANRMVTVSDFISVSYPLSELEAALIHNSAHKPDIIKTLIDY